MSALERKRDVDRLEKNVAKWFSWQGRLVAKKLPSLKKYFQESAVSDIDSILDGAFKTTINDGERFIVDGLRDGVEAGWDDLSDELSMQKAFALDDPKATAWAKERAAEAVSEVNDTTKETIRNMVSKGIEEGKDYDTVAKQISKRFSEFAIGKPQEHIQSRAHLVAINENAVAYEHGQRELVDEITDAGIDMAKSWATVGDNNVSDGCQRNANENWIKSDASFSSGDQNPPRFPGCRCSSRYRVAREA